MVETKNCYKGLNQSILPWKAMTSSNVYQKYNFENAIYDQEIKRIKNEFMTEDLFLELSDYSSFIRDFPHLITYCFSDTSINLTTEDENDCNQFKCTQL
jgi:hypothetical protein